MNISAKYICKNHTINYWNNTNSYDILDDNYNRLETKTLTPELAGSLGLTPVSPFRAYSGTDRIGMIT